MGIRVACLALVLTACSIENRLVPCGDLLCPIGMVCSSGGCVTQEAADACNGKVDGDACMTMSISNGTCSGGACYALLCGNRIVERDEVCDDGNQASGDGCSADCRSLELCGNAVPDPQAGEECDSGIAGLSGDGCASTCVFENDLWRDITPGPPARREDHAMIYDSVRNVSVLFGGIGGTQFGDTWEWDGTAWTQRQPLTSPGARNQHAMAFDATRNKTVLFGGSDGTNRFSDTWEYDGANWVQRTLGVAPSARTNAVMAYYPACACSVLFGGHDASGYLGDTWMYDASGWTPIAATGPSARESAAAAYDASTNSVLVFGGQDGGVLADTWRLSWNGTTWAWTPGAAGPSARRESAMVAVSGGVVMFGGNSSAIGIFPQTPLKDAWSWNNGSWSSVSAANLPQTSYGHTVVFDVARGQVVLFGGQTTSSTLGDLFVSPPSSWFWSRPPTLQGRAAQAVAYDARRGRIVMLGGNGPFGFPVREHYEFDGLNWVERPITTPVARAEQGMVYDEARGQVVMFGGHDQSYAYLQETWLFDGQSWTKPVLALEPARRNAPAMTYDSTRKVVVLVGGRSTTGYVNDVWEWNGTAWSQVAGPSPFTPRSHSKIAYDPIRQRVVLFGGLVESPTFTAFNDTWEWDGVTWKDVSPAVSPTPRGEFGLVYDPLRRRVVLFGGGDRTTLFDDTWEWDGAAWTRQQPLVSPPAVRSHAMAYDAILRRMVAIGGETAAFAASDRTWARGFESGGPTAEQCLRANDDTDHDGLVGCADPDCYGRCTPLCMPGTVCDPADPHCGDGTCGPVEDSAICPTDCP